MTTTATATATATNVDTNVDTTLFVKEPIDFIKEFNNIGIINTSHIAFALFGICYIYLSGCFIVNVVYKGSKYLFDALWNSLDKGDEWLQIAVIVSTIWATVCVLRFANDMDDRIENYITKLKAEIEEKNATIVELQSKLQAVDNLDTDNFISDDESVWETDSESGLELEDDSDSDSDYDPDEDEY